MMSQECCHVKHSFRVYFIVLIKKLNFIFTYMSVFPARVLGAAKAQKNVLDLLGLGLQEM